MRYNAKTSEYFLELLRCVLHDKPACRKPEEISWEELFDYAKSQSLSTMAYRAVRKSGVDLGAELAQKWSTRNAMNLVKHCNQEIACENLCKTFSDAGIVHMPLKGSLIGKLFPAPEMREMCDLDILVLPEDRERAHTIMMDRGYSYIKAKTTSHNREYHKLPYLNVEIHTEMVPQESEMYPYYSGYLKKAVQANSALTCRMSWDDCYVFMLAHAYKHFYLYGTGIRAVMDIYIMRDRLKDILNRGYIEEELKRLDIFDFAERFERLADCWFAEERTEIPQALLEDQIRVLSMAPYRIDPMKAQAMEMMKNGKSLGSAKRTMAISKLFPSFAYMKKMYPLLKYVPILLPLFWLIRWFSTLLVKPKVISLFFRKLRRLSLTDEDQERRL